MSRIQLRRGTSAQWTDVNPTLYSGELGFETDTGQIKIGDGVTAWVSLAYTSLDWNTLANKPSYIAAGASKADARTAIDAEYTGNKGQPGGYASLDSNGYIPLAQWGAQVVNGGSAASSTTDIIDGGSA